MARPRTPRKRTLYERQTVVDIEHTGHGIVKPEGKVIFVEDALPGEVVDVVVTRSRRNHAFGMVERHHLRSPQRVEPFCSHFGVCGGCRWQYLSYARQLEYKHSFVRSIMLRIGGLDDLEVLPILGCRQDRFYRNKLDFSFTDARWLSREEIAGGGDNLERRGAGFHVRGRFDRILDIDTCHLQPEPSNAIRRAVRDFTIAADHSYYNSRSHCGWLRSLVVRTSSEGQVMVTVVFGSAANEAQRERLFDMIESTFPSVVSINYIVNTTLNDSLAAHRVHRARGTDFVVERCGDLRLRIHPRSFYQTNPLQAERLYGLVEEWAALNGTQTVWDLYCGIGSIALFLARRAGLVWGVETVAEAIDNARENALGNGIGNVVFCVADVKDALCTPPPEALPSGADAPDLLVLDPPRAGLHPAVVKSILQLAAPRIIYVSCNPTTQARDVQMMSGDYRAVRCRPVDMFPHTHHIESVIELQLR
ncbi:MAG: 23S rRNA (uracil(1939)-C(5))-methyltransferase RlmD [Spirochaetaceae bacterium]|nr:MAG: 23S rRNA (uracil(1939)-C(5))-methyltransferase RlmD [Spirochaetaceae bacterium]